MMNTNPNQKSLLFVIKDDDDDDEEAEVDE